MRLFKKLLKITGITVLLVIAALFLIPVFFKKQITTLVKKEINKNLTAKVDFKDLTLSVFRHFPRIDIALKDVTVVGLNEFANDTLVSSKTLNASVNLISALKGKSIKVYGVYLESPRIHALVNKNGKANWDIAKADTDIPDTLDSSPSSFRMSLEEYEVNNGYLYYNDEVSNMSAEVSGLHHEGSGDFTEDVFTLSTFTSADAAGFIYETIPYLADTRTQIKTDIIIDNSTGKYTFKTNDISLNDLKLNAEGFFQLVNDSTYEMDINFKTPSNQFKDILSLVPAIYRQDFDQIKTSGQAILTGFIKGTYSEEQLPAYDLDISVKDGSFQYPDLPKPVNDIQIEMKVSNSDGKPDNAVVDISRGHFKMDNEPFDFKLVFKNPETVKYVDAMAKGKIDLANVTQFIKLEGNTRLSGLVWADAFAKGNMSDSLQQPGNFTAGGFFDIKDLFYSSNSFPQPIKNGNIKVELANSVGIADNTTVNISSGHIEVGNDPLDFTLQLSKPVSTMNFSGTAKGNFTLEHVKQFVNLDQGTSIGGTVNADVTLKGNKAAIDKGEFDKINVSGTAGLKNLRYVSIDYPSGLNVSTAQVSFTPKNVTLNKLNAEYLNTNLSADGSFDNLIGFALKQEALAGNLNVAADKINLNDWMGTDTVTASSTLTNTSGAFLVPAKVDLKLNAKAKQVTYDNVHYNNLAGTVAIKDESVKLQNVKADALDGTILLNGSYSTKTNKKEPEISMNYDVKGLDIQKTFLSFNTIRALMPVGKFLSGRLSSQLSMTGNLDAAMMPELNSLTGKGNLLLVEGVLKNFTPLEKLATILQIDRLKSLTLKDIKNYIEFDNGKVLVKPFTIKVDDIEMQVGGMHGFDQSMDYVIAMKVPRKYMGTKGNNTVNDLVTKANAKGIPVKLGETVDLNVKMGGKITNPSIQIDLKQVAGDAIDDLKQQAIDFAKAKADSAKTMITDSLKAVKNQVVNDLKEEIKDRVFGNKDSTKAFNADSTKKKAGQTIKKTFDNLLNKKKKQPADTAR